MDLHPLVLAKATIVGMPRAWGFACGHTQGAVATHNSLGAMGAPNQQQPPRGRQWCHMPRLAPSKPPSIVSLLLLATNATLLLGLLPLTPARALACHQTPGPQCHT